MNRSMSSISSPFVFDGYIFVFDGYIATILSVFEYDVDIEFKNIDRKLVGDLCGCETNFISAYVSIYTI